MSEKVVTAVRETPGTEHRAPDHTNSPFITSELVSVSLPEESADKLQRYVRNHVWV